MDAPGRLGKRRDESSPLALDPENCYIITLLGPTKFRRPGTMPTHVHSHTHHHHPGTGHPPASISPSILRMSVLERLAIAAVLIAVLWGAVVWAMTAVTA